MAKSVPSRRNQNRTKNATLGGFEKLEDRRLLTTLYLDFGDRFENQELAVTEQEYIDVLGGTRIGSQDDDHAFRLESFSESIVPDVVEDFGTVDALDVAFIRSNVVEQIQRMFAPFDVQVVELTSSFTQVNGVDVRAASSVADVVSTFAADPGNDAYVFVTETIQTAGPGIPGSVTGIAPVDAGNSENTTALLFSQYAYARHDGFAEQNSYVSLLSQIAGKHAGMSFGLERTKSGSSSTPAQDRLSYSEVMSESLTNPRGFETGFHRTIYNFFSRVELDTTFQTIAPVQNSYELLATNVGAADIGYISGTGAHDIITITSSAADTVNVVISAFDNATHTGTPIGSFMYSNIDISNGLLVEAGYGSDIVDLPGNLGRTVTVRGMIGNDVVSIDGLGGAQATVQPQGFGSTNIDFGDGSFFELREITDSGILPLMSYAFVQNLDELIVDTTLFESNISIADSRENDDHAAVAFSNRNFGEVSSHRSIPIEFKNIPTLSITSGVGEDRFTAIVPNLLNATGLQNVTWNAGDGDDVFSSQSYRTYPLPVPGGEFRVDGEGGTNTVEIVHAFTNSIGETVVVDGVDSGVLSDWLYFDSFANIHSGIYEDTIVFQPGGLLSGLLDTASVDDVRSQYNPDIVDLSAMSAPHIEAEIVAGTRFNELSGSVVSMIGSFRDVATFISNSISPGSLEVSSIVPITWNVTGDAVQMDFDPDYPIQLQNFKGLYGADEAVNIFNVDFVAPQIRNFTIVGGGENDQFFAENANGPVGFFGGDGNDLYFVRSGVGTALTLFDVAGTNYYEVALNTSGTRRIDISGSPRLNDRLLVIGSLSHDIIDITSNSITDSSINTEFDQIEIPQLGQIEIKTRTGNDEITLNNAITGLLDIKTNTGNDRVTVNRTQDVNELMIRTGADRDRVFVNQVDAETTFDLNTNNHNDFIYIGSTAGQDNGDLSLIRGAFSLKGGVQEPGGSDRLYINDRGTEGDFIYEVSPTLVSSPGRPVFGGIAYDASIEILRLDGTDGENTFDAIPGFYTRYVFDGNQPDVATGDRLNIIAGIGAGAQHFPAGNTGSGVWTFSNGYKNVHYVGMESSSSSNGSLPYISTAPAIAFAKPVEFGPVDFSRAEYEAMTNTTKRIDAADLSTQNSLLDQAIQLMTSNDGVSQR